MLRKIRMDREDDIDALFRVMNRTDAHYYEFADDGSADLRLSGPEHPVNKLVGENSDWDSPGKSAPLVRTISPVLKRRSAYAGEANQADHPDPEQPGRNMQARSSGVSPIRGAPEPTKRASPSGIHQQRLTDVLNALASSERGLVEQAAKKTKAA